MWAQVYVKFDHESSNELHVFFRHAYLINTLDNPWLIPDPTPLKTIMMLTTRSSPSMS